MGADKEEQGGYIVNPQRAQKHFRLRECRDT